MKLESEVRVALSALREASRLCQEVQATLDPGTLSKADRSPVTVADFGSQALICRALAEAFPEDPVIAEESAEALREPGEETLRDRIVGTVRSHRPGMGADEVLGAIDHGGASDPAPRLWTLDPIDGTKGFLRGDQYAIALALIVDGQVVFGALGCPNLACADLAAGRIARVDASGPEAQGSLLYGMPGLGAFLVPLDPSDAPPVPLTVSTRDDPRDTRICESVESGHTVHGASARIAERLGVRVPPTRIDSQAKYAAVAAGAAEAYLRLPSKPGYVEKIWDHAAGVAMVEAAGGSIADVDGRRLDFGHGALLEANRGAIVTNRSLHERIVVVVGEELRERNPG